MADGKFSLVGCAGVNETNRVIVRKEQCDNLLFGSATTRKACYTATSAERDDDFPPDK